jgi:hypothetical protein
MHRERQNLKKEKQNILNQAYLRKKFGQEEEKIEPEPVILADLIAEIEHEDAQEAKVV